MGGEDGQGSCIVRGQRDGDSQVQAVKKVMTRRAFMCCAGKTTDWASESHRLDSGADTV